MFIFASIAHYPRIFDLCSLDSLSPCGTTCKASTRTRIWINEREVGFPRGER